MQENINDQIQRLYSQLIKLCQILIWLELDALYKMFSGKVVWMFLARYTTRAPSELSHLSWEKKLLPKF